MLTVIINENTTGKTLQLVTLYWEMKDEAFVNQPLHLGAAFGLHRNALKKIIRDHSCLKLTLGYCIHCKDEISERFSAQSGYKELKNRINAAEICGACRMKIYQQTTGKTIK